MQSCIIGKSFHCKRVCLRQFSTSSFRSPSPSTPRRIISNLFYESLQKVSPSLVNAQNVNITTSLVDGIDYQSNNAFLLSKQMKKPPLQVAEEIVKNFPSSDSIDSVIASAPGFVNITLNKSWIGSQVHQLIQMPSPGVPNPFPPPSHQKVVIDYSSPNMCKELHVGHLRSMVLGESIARILDYMGHSVTRLSHVGDFGTPIGMVLAQSEESKASFLSPPYPLPSPTELSELYTTAKKRFDSDPAFATKSLEFAKLLQLKDPRVKGPWETLCAASRKGFDDIYRRLKITVTEKGESTYAEYLPSLVRQLTEEGLSTNSQGAQVIWLPDYSAPFIIQKSDGAFLYATTDLAALKERLSQQFEWLIYVTDESQKVHFKQLFQVGEKAGWYDPKATKIDHLTFGVVKGPNGKKLSSRDGTPITLKALLDEAVIEASHVVNNHQLSEGRTEEEKEKIISSIAYNAVKYFDLRHSKDYIFSFDSILSLKGNTAVYLMYAYTRIRSIQRKKTETLPKDHSIRISLSTPQERVLGLTLLRFPDILEEVHKTLSPHLLCEYLFTLAQHFHTFYEMCRIYDTPEEAERLLLCEAVERTLWQGMTLLGLEPTDQM